jgi:hypothetical protein
VTPGGSISELIIPASFRDLIDVEAGIFRIFFEPGHGPQTAGTAAGTDVHAKCTSRKNSLSIHCLMDHKT